MRAEDARGFFAWLPTSSWARWHPIFLFALATAARRGEVLALRRENIDLTRGIAIIAESLAESRGLIYRKATKTEHIREVPLSPLALEALQLADELRKRDQLRAQEAYEDHDLVFASPSGTFIRPMTVTDAFRRAADAFGKPEYTLHTLRHTAATWLLTSGADLRTTSSILGHTDAATTLRVYSHVVSERQHSAVALIGDVLQGISRNGDLGRTLGRTEDTEQEKNPVDTGF
jgi:integrase